MQHKILVVEDDRPSARLVESTLEKEGYQVIMASNGVQGLKKAMDEAPDLVILDVMLPGLDGFEVCHRLKSQVAYAGVPILMLSAKSQESDLRIGEKVGADQYLVKTMDPSQILAAVENLLKPNGPSPANPSGEGN